MAVRCGRATSKRAKSPQQNHDDRSGVGRQIVVVELQNVRGGVGRRRRKQSGGTRLCSAIEERIFIVLVIV